MHIYLLEAHGSDYYDDWNVVAVYKSIVHARKACTEAAIAQLTAEDTWDRPAAGEGEQLVLHTGDVEGVEDCKVQYEAVWAVQPLKIDRDGKLTDRRYTGIAYRVTKELVL